MNIVVVLSSTILIVDGIYERKTIALSEVPSIEGLDHYIGHPDTRKLAESAFKLIFHEGKFGGLKNGETALCLPLQNLDRSQGWSVDTAISSMKELQFVTITRLK